MTRNTSATGKKSCVLFIVQVDANKRRSRKSNGKITLPIPARKKNHKCLKHDRTLHESLSESLSLELIYIYIYIYNIRFVLFLAVSVS